ncbi:MAG: helix-turn-helix transcriptional regulator [Verrucomicrobiae bacterium]|nr:helix-turn-helix transcriptional regulator [Verrucomicrobiae bacterium]
MSRSYQQPFPAAEKQMRALGQRLKAARLRRKMTTILFAERMGVSRDTLNRMEKGDANIALGTYVRALRVLGLDRDMDAVARDDALGRALQDQSLLSKYNRGHQPRTASTAKPVTQKAPENPSHAKG